MLALLLCSLLEKTLSKLDHQSDRSTVVFMITEEWNEIFQISFQAAIGKQTPITPSSCCFVVLDVFQAEEMLTAGTPKMLHGPSSPQADV